jgi:Zn-dependent peptidase ImmA (M78 family)
MVERVIDVGDVKGFRLQIVWANSGTARSAAEFTRGDALLWVAEELVWGEQAGTDLLPFQWTWIELLEFLAHAWPYLEWEEGYPRGLQPSRPSMLRAVAEGRWQEQTEERSIQEEIELFAFEENHDLARSLQGAVAPSVWLVREGNLMWVASKRRAVMRPVLEILGQLAAIGEAVKAQVSSCGDIRAKTAVEDWEARRNLPQMEIAEIATRIPGPMIQRLLSAAPSDERPDQARGDFHLTEVLAAARLVAGSLSPEIVERVMSVIAALPKVPTPRLDQLSQDAEGLIDRSFPKKPHDEGYSLAAWFRGVMGIDELAPVELDDLLRMLGVPIQDNSIPDERLDAFACWGPRHGPTVVLNTSGKHAQSPPGRKATLGHELCHLLIDRTGALPLAEVLNGRAPRRVEARAKAFAAELLLPRRQAEAVSRRSPDIGEAVESLRSEYRVSQELVAWQIRNSGVLLSEEQLAILRSMVSDPDSF